jgi:hypothetical protein
MWACLERNMWKMLCKKVWGRKIKWLMPLRVELLSFCSIDILGWLILCVALQASTTRCQ